MKVTTAIRTALDPRHGGVYVHTHDIAKIIEEFAAEAELISKASVLELARDFLRIEVTT
jgi:hypothetical protein